jgi:hypothetical protein
MRTSLKMLCVATAVFLSTAAARADVIPWGYSSSDTQIFNSNNPLKSSSVQFSGSSGAVAAPDNKSGIIIYTMATSSGADTSAPDSFSAVPFNLSVTLTDINATGSKSAGAVKSGVVNLAGTFSASDVTKSSMFPGANIWDSTPVTLKLGADDTGWNDYTLQLVSLTPPGVAGGGPGSILATVAVTPDSGTPTPGGGPPPLDGSGSPPGAAPEPTGLVLAGLALPALLAARRRTKRSQPS